MGRFGCFARDKFNPLLMGLAVLLALGLGFRGESVAHAQSVVDGSNLRDAESMGTAAALTRNNSRQIADTILFDANVKTMTASKPVAQAVAIKGSKIIAVG